MQTRDNMDGDGFRVTVKKAIRAVIDGDGWTATSL
jgi:hypothetical protein